MLSRRCFISIIRVRKVSGCQTFMVVVRILRSSAFSRKLIPYCTSLTLVVLSPRKNPPPIQWFLDQQIWADWVSRWSGIWAGCTTSLSIWNRIPFIVAIIMISLPLVCCMHLPKILYCLFHMMKLYMVKVRCATKCPEMSGSSLLICGYFIPLCTAIPAKNYYLWDQNLVRAVSGIVKKHWNGIYWITQNIRAYYSWSLI